MPVWCNNECNIGMYRGRQVPRLTGVEKDMGSSPVVYKGHNEQTTSLNQSMAEWSLWLQC